MSVTCSHCGGNVTMKPEKLMIVIGGSVIMAPLAAAFGLKAGQIALLAAAWGGNANASRLLQLKMQLMKQSNKLGSFFHCTVCHKDATVEEVFRQIL